MSREFSLLHLTASFYLPIFTQLMDVYYLYSKQHDRIQMSYIKKFESFAHLQKQSEAVEDLDILGKCLIVNTHKDSVPSNIERIK